MQQKIDAAVVVLYNPEENVFDNISTYIDFVGKLYVIDNSNLEHDIVTKLLHFKNVEVLYIGKNIGIAKSLNLAIDKAYNQNHQWLITFDQDTSFNPNDFNLFLKSFNKLNDEKIALVSPLHNKKFITFQNENVFSGTEYVMTSANIVNVSICKKIGGYDENLFIDEVDHEFCFRLKKHEYVILVNHTIAVNHALGLNYNLKSNLKLYPSIRLYYMIRNYLYLKKKYYHEHKNFFKQRDKYLLKFFKNQIFYGENRIKNIKMILQGILDYHNRKFGKFQNED